MVATRLDITFCLIVIVGLMICMHLWAFLVCWRAKFEKRLENLQREGEEEPWVMKPRNDIHIGVSSVRFRVSTDDGEIRFFAPSELASQYFSLKASTVARMQYQPGGAILTKPKKLENFNSRLRRALLGGNSSVNGTGRLNAIQMWSKLEDWPDSEKLISQGSFGQVLSFLSHVKITQATGSRRGTQLKLELLLEGGRLAFFKPAWYDRDVVLRGDPFGGKDRHFGEVAAFYLAQLLGYFSGPLVVGRKINVEKEILPYSSRLLNSTFFKKSNGDLCFYGVCYYCKKDDPVCSNQNVIEGAVVLQMSQKLKSFPNPWRRTYKKDQFATWERNMSFCQNVLEQVGSSEERTELLLDIVAVAAFDFLIGNADRHGLDLFTIGGASSGHVRNIALLDNGKSFGDSDEDYYDILAPLYQCCIIRPELHSVLKQVRGGLGSTLDSMTVFDPLYPLLTPAHLTAMDRRLDILLATIEVCQDRTNQANM